MNQFDKDDGEHWYVSRANQGLIDIRRGNVELGIANYRVAIDGFKTKDMFTNALLAQIYLAREVALANVKDASELYKSVEEYKKYPEFKVRAHLFEQTEAALRKRGQISDG